ncbi:MAG: hypothetical protein V1722_00255 [Candidatus Micrarchaeota archaeon]
MTIEKMEHAKMWFEKNGIRAYGLLRHGGDRMAIRLADIGSKNEDAAKTVKGINDAILGLYHARGDHFVRQHVLPLVATHARVVEQNPALAASLLLDDLHHLQKSATPIAMQGISDVPEANLGSVSTALTRLINKQQFFDPEAYGTHYHKDPEHTLKKENVVGRTGAELHGNVLCGKKGAFALIGDPRIGKGRLSFLLSYLHGCSIIADDRVHILFSTKGANVVGPYRKYGFRAASQYYSRGRMFHQGVFGSPDSPDFPREVKETFWKHGSDPEIIFKGKPVPSVKNAPLHDNVNPARLNAVFLMETHAAPSTAVVEVNAEHVARYLAKRDDVGVPTVFGYPQTYPLKTKLNEEQRLALSQLVVSKLAQKGVRFYSVRVPPDPKEIPVVKPSRDVRHGTPFDNRAAAAEAIARIMEKS